MTSDTYQDAIKKAYLETEKVENDYRKIDHYQWSEVKPFITAYLRYIGWQFRLNAGWLSIIDMIFRECLKLRKLWLGALLE